MNEIKNEGRSQRGLQILFELGRAMGIHFKGRNKMGEGVW